jgi:hypothetical protein
MNYYLYPYPADMRRGFYSLSGLVHDVMSKDIRSGNVFIFINRYCTGMKILHMEYSRLSNVRSRLGASLIPFRAHASLVVP